MFIVFKGKYLLLPFFSLLFCFNKVLGLNYDLNPIAAFSFSPSSATCYQSITFDASASYHPNPARSIIKYEWDFDAPSLNEFQVEKTGMIVIHSYPLLGSYNAWLRVTDDLGFTATVSQIIDVNLGNLPPIANAGGPYITPLGSSIVLDGQGSIDPNMPCDRIVSYLWDINNDSNFGDLTGPNPTLVVSSPIFQVGRMYLIRLRVTDLLGLLSNISETTLLVQDPVPVELSSFIAKVEGTTVILNWRTETESNNYGFEIERSIKDNFEKIGFVFGAGNSNSPKEYTFTDNNLVGGSKFLYRLKQIDADGEIEFSSSLEVEVFPNQYELIQSYPNPANPSTKIMFSLPYETELKILLYNMLGESIRTIAEGKYDAGFYQVELLMNDLASGVYIYKLESKDFVSTKKLILLK
jgi:hypothetical protein